MKEEKALEVMCAKCGPGHSSSECPRHDKWERSQQYWSADRDQEQALSAGLAKLTEYGVGLIKPETSEGDRDPLPNLLQNLSGTREEAEAYGNPWSSDRSAYGALPHFSGRREIVANFSKEAEYFEQTYVKGGRFDVSYAEGAMLFALKFGRPLSEFAEEILVNYPDLGTGEGSEVSLFGLSGSGKSSVVEILKESLGDNVVVMDSDTVRYNLLAKMIKDVELENGASLEDVRGELMHNNISGSLYFMLSHVAKIMKARGYTIVQSSTMPHHGADKYIYIEHPDGIDPKQVNEEDIPGVARTLFERTSARVPDRDDYDWDDAKTVTNFNSMKPVTVQVPEFVHGIFLKNLKGVLETRDDIERLSNPKIDDPVEREGLMRKKVAEILNE